MENTIKLYDLQGNLVAFLENAFNIVIEEKLNDVNILMFSIPCDDAKADIIKHDQEVTFENKRYIITQIVDSQGDGSGILEVTCELACIELLNATKQGEFVVDRKSAAEGLKQILHGTNWTIGLIEAEPSGVYSLKEANKTVLWLVRQWAKIIGCEIQWDSIKRTINMLKQVGSDKGAVFRFKKNLRAIKRTIKPPEATVLYAYGKNGLSIADFNNGKPYLEDYSWYVSQGISLTEAKQRYRKEYIWQDDRFLLTANLLEAAKKKLAELSQPSISYECSVIDLSSVTGLTEDKFFIGDIVRVYDSELNIDVKTRILRLKRYPQEPWRNEIELNTIIPGLQDAEEKSIASDVAAAQPSMLYASNNQQLTLTATQQYPISLSITNFSATNAQIGLMIVGQASTALTLTIKFYLAGAQIGPTIQHQCQAGWNTIGVPFVFAQLQPGSAMLDMQVYTSTGQFVVASEHMQLYVYAANLLGGIGADLPRAIWEENITVGQISLAAEVATQMPISGPYEQTIAITAAVVTDVNITIV